MIGPSRAALHPDTSGIPASHIYNPPRLL